MRDFIPRIPTFLLYNMVLTLKNIAPARDQRMAIIGQTGTGKSFLAKRLISKAKNLAIIDPKRTFKYPDIPVFDTPGAILKAKPKRFMYRPKPELLDNLNAYNEVYKYCYHMGDILVYTDDVVGILDVQKFPRYLRICYQMGREKNVSCICAFQRPAWLPRFLLSEVQKLCVFRLTMKDDIKKIQEIMPGFDPSKFPDKHTFYFYDCDTMDAGQMTRIDVTKGS